MQIQPFGERVVIKIVNPEEKVGALIVATSKEKSNRGQIVAVSDEVQSNLKAGDTVVFSIGAGVSYTSGNEDYKIINVKDILGKIVGD